MILFIIPGNPGIGDFYQELQNSLLNDWMSDDYKSQKPKKSKNSNKFYNSNKSKKPMEIHIITYSSFQKDRPKRVNSIREEALYIQERMEEILKTKPKSNRVVAIGHSIGSWILKEIMLSKPDLIHQGIFLFPFLALDESNTKQRLIHRLLRLPLLDHLVLGIYRIIQLLPYSWKKISINPLIKSMSNEAKNLTLENFIKLKHIPRSVILLAKTEFATLPPELSQAELNSLNKIQEKSIYIFNSQDIWAPMSHMESLQLMCPQAKYVLLPHIPHDFCVYRSANLEVSQTILNFLDRP
jgi:pimeloyl-ACP methyl ester carboxylesterase